MEQRDRRRDLLTSTNSSTIKTYQLPWLTCELTGITEASVSAGTNPTSIPDRHQPTSGQTEAPPAHPTVIYHAPRRHRRCAESLTSEFTIDRFTPSCLLN